MPVSSRRSQSSVGGVKRKLKKHKVHALFAVKFNPQRRQIILQPREDVLAERALLAGKFVLQTPEVAWNSDGHSSMKLDSFVKDSAYEDA